MFTFSFSSAFAANPNTTIADRTAAMAKITDKYNDELAKLDSALAVVKAGTKNPSDATAADWAAACQEAYDAVKAKLDAQLAEAYQEFGVQEQAASKYEGGIQGYDYESQAPTTADGYVYYTTALAKINASEIKGDANWNGTAFTGVKATSAEYKTVLAKTRDLVKNYNLEKFAKDDKVTRTVDGKKVTKTSYEWAVDAQNDAIAYLSALSEKEGTVVTINGKSVVSDKNTVEGVYKVVNAGTVGETATGTFADALKDLKTTQTLTTDKAKTDYAKAKAMAYIKSAIEAQRTADLDVQNQKIFQQSVAAKPNQAVIDTANKEIKAINEKYDALIEVLTYRFDNAKFTVEQSANYVRAYYNDEPYNAINDGNSCIGTYDAQNGFTPIAPIASNMTYNDVKTILTAEKAKEIVDKIADLKDEAAKLKATVLVDGTTALDVDEALKDAIDSAYMTGNGSIARSFSDTAVHVNAHKLLGTACTKNGVAAKATVTLSGKEYPTVENWTKAGYSDKNTDAVKAIIKDAKAAIKAATTIDAANKAFLDAYAKYDAVLTTAKQKALFNYNGALYKKDEAAKAELKAYIAYKVQLMGDKAPATDTADKMEAYLGVAGTAPKADFLAEVVDDASLQTAIADVKAKADAIKTKDELKAEGEALVKEVAAVKRPVTLEQKEAVLALYDKVTTYKNYCEMVGYTYPALASENLLKTDIQSLASLEKTALDNMKKELGDVNKITLANEAAVTAYVNAQDAYNDVYGKDGKYKAALTAPADYNDADAYDTKIFNLKVEAAVDLIKALPVNATQAQVTAAKKAVDDLGFKGLCSIDQVWLTKLSKFTQDANQSVENLKITAGSTAKKGSITVKWTVKGDKSGVEAYEVWKSTKKNAGFKKVFTTKKQTYKNTKGLKKGTRYYYKVRAIAHVDGKKVTSDWSNKAIRKAK